MSIVLHLRKQCANFCIWVCCIAITSTIVDKTDHAYMELVYVVDGVEGGSMGLQVVAIEQDTAYKHPDDWRITTSLA